MTGHRTDGPHPLRSPTEPFGLSTLTSDERDLVDRDTGLLARMWLHALSTAGRRVHPNPSDGTSMVAFMLKQPSVEQHMASSHSAWGSVPSFWNTQLWQTYAEEAGWFEVHFRQSQGPLGHAGDKPTTVGTNLSDLGDLRVLKGKDPESRNHRPATFKYFLAVSYCFPRLKGVKEEPDPCTTDGFDDPALLPGGTDDLADEAFPAAEGAPREDYEDSLYEPSLQEEEAEEEGVEGPREFAAKVVDEHPWESAKCEFQPPPEMARLVFAVPLHTNKGDDILNALQQVYISLSSLNLPVLRFHTDRSREFFNKRTRAWFHERGVRTTTTEGDVPQQNGSAENTRKGLCHWLRRSRPARP